MNKRYIWLLTTTYDEDANTLTFETNKFSTYVIAYTPAGSGSGGGGTGGSSGSSSSGGKRIKGYVDENGYLIAGGNTKDSEPRTGEAAALPMASMAMVAGLSYLLDLFKERKRTLSEAVGEQKERIVSWIIRKAKYRHLMIRCLALGLIGLVLILYGAIQKVVQFDKREGQEET